MNIADMAVSSYIPPLLIAEGHLDVCFLAKRNGRKSGAAHATPPTPYAYSIARICSIRDCFFCLRTVHTDKISSIPNNTRMNRPISKTGNL